MIVGFTGTSRGLTAAQDTALGVLLEELAQDTPIAEAHHGDCVEGDARFDAHCARMGIERHAHPGHDRYGDSPLRAHCKAEVIYPSDEYLARNRAIVAAADVVVACPDGPERPRGGTWYTVRRAREAHRPVVIVWPNGKVDR